MLLTCFMGFILLLTCGTCTKYVCGRPEELVTIVTSLYHQGIKSDSATPLIPQPGFRNYFDS